MPAPSGTDRANQAGSSHPQPAFLYSNGTVTDLGSFSPSAINDNGQIVANATDSDTLLLNPG